MFQKPRWRNIMYDATNTCCGQVLVGYALIKVNDALLVEQEDIYPACTERKLHMLNIGLRDIIKEIGGIKP